MTETGKKIVTRSVLRWLGRAATVMVSALILYLVMRRFRLGLDEVMEAVTEADYVMAWAGMLIPLLIFWVTDAAYTARSFQWFDKPVLFRDYLVIKAAAYLLAMVNITFAAGGVLLYFSRKVGTPVRKQLGILMWRETMAILGCAILFAALAVVLCVFEPDRAGEAGIGFWIPVIAGTALLMLDFGFFFFRGRGLLLKNLPFDYSKDFWSAFSNSRPVQWAQGVAYTLPAIFAYCLGLYFTALAFDVRVPLLVFLFWIPLVALISALPVAFSNFGTTTAAWVAFFAAYGSAADIAALTLFIPASRLLIRLVLGGIFIPSAMRELNSLVRPDEKGLVEAASHEIE